MTAIERWLAIPGYEGFFEVSDLGRVRSIDRQIVHRNRWGSTTEYRKRGLVLRGFVRRDGYPAVNLKALGASKTFAIHSLVLTAFRGARPSRMECCHSNGVRADNRLENLRWDTSRANHIDAVKHGRSGGPLWHRSKYDHSAIKALRDGGASLPEIRAITGISRGHLFKVLAGWNWRRSGVPL